MLSLGGLPLRGNSTDNVLDLVTKTKFHLKIMKFVANSEKLVLGAIPKGIDLGLEKPYLTDQKLA